MGRKVGSGCGGTHVYLWPIHPDVWEKPSQNCKVIVLQLKINKSKKKIFFFLKDSHPVMRAQLDRIIMGTNWDLVGPPLRPRNCPETCWF